MRKNAGFTLIEVVVTMTIIALVGVVTYLNLQGGQNATDLVSVNAQVTSLLREAQSDATSNKNDTAWSVYFSNATNTSPFYALVASAIYSTSSVVAKYPLPSDVAYVSSTLASGASITISFQAVSGATTPTTIQLYSTKTPSLIETITVNTPGLVI